MFSNMKRNESGDVTPVIVSAILGSILIICFFGGLFLEGKDDNLREVAREMEAWSVAHPASTFSGDDTFSVKDFINESDSNVKIRNDYNIKRVSTSHHDVICFTDPKNEDKTTAYSYQRGMVDDMVCKN